MSSATVPTSIRLTPAEKRRIATAARKRGLSPAAYIQRVALESTTAAVPNDAKLERLALLVHQVRAAVEDEIDYRTAAAAWDRHVKSGEKTLTGEEVWRAVGV
jgi:predicted nucleic acid-binding Zn ribbon protein